MIYTMDPFEKLSPEQVQERSAVVDRLTEACEVLKRSVDEHAGPLVQRLEAPAAVPDLKIVGPQNLLDAWGEYFDAAKEAVNVLGEAGLAALMGDME